MLQQTIEIPMWALVVTWLGFGMAFAEVGSKGMKLNGILHGLVYLIFVILWPMWLAFGLFEALKKEK